MNEAEAYSFVAAWHREQARIFLQMAEDEPRLDLKTRNRSREAAAHHNGSAAALELKTHSIRKSLIEYL
jgi:hypothetical protein